MTKYTLFGSIRIMTAEMRGMAHIPEAKGDNVVGSIATPTIELGRLSPIDFNDPKSGARLVAAGASGIGSLSFGGIADLIARTPGMTNVDIRQLENSWREGLSILALRGERIVAHARLKVGGIVTPKNEAEARILCSVIPRRVYELASVISTPEERGSGLGPLVMEAALGLKIDEVKRGEAVYITTTEVANFPKGLQRAGMTHGIRFVPIVPTDVEGIGHAACGNCAGIICPKRVAPEGIRKLINSNEFPENCVTYMSVPNYDGELFQNGMASNPGFQANGKNGAQSW